MTKIPLTSFHNAIDNARIGDQRIKLNKDQTDVVSGTPYRGTFITFLKKGAAKLGFDSGLKSHHENNTVVRRELLNTLKPSVQHDAVAKKLDSIVEISARPLTSREAKDYIATAKNVQAKADVAQTLIELEHNYLPSKTKERIILELLNSYDAPTSSTIQELVSSILMQDEASAASERRQQGITDNAESRIGVMKPIGEVTVLGSGKVNTVYQGDFGGIKKGVFKPSIVENGELHEAAKGIGIPPKQPNFTGRSVAAAVVSQLLGSTLVGKTAFAEHDGMHGFVTEFARGKAPREANYEQITNQAQISAFNDTPEERRKEDLENNDRIQTPGGRYYELTYKYDNIDYTEPSLAARLTELHLFDELIGQADRHMGNLFIDVGSSTNQLSVTAIDNDFSFGTLAVYKGAFTAKLPKDLPPIVPQSVSDRFLNLDGNGLRTALDGLLQKDEIEATVERLQSIQSHLSDLGLNSGIITDQEWKQPLIQEHANSDNSYIGRFAAEATPKSMA